MPLIDFILNLAGLLLWLNWRSSRIESRQHTSLSPLGRTLRRAGATGRSRWLIPLGALVALLAIRAVVYWKIGPDVNWAPSLQFTPLTLPFRGNQLKMMALFSALGFLFTLAVFYLWLLFFSVMNGRLTGADSLQSFMRLHLGRVDRWPRVIKLVIPFIAGALLWLALYPLVAHLAIIPVVQSRNQLLEQCAVMGLGVYIVWTYPIAAVLFLHLVNSYVYLGNSPLWQFINSTARALLLPFKWLPLRFGRVDFLPLIEMALVFLIAETFSRLPVLLPAIATRYPELTRMLPFNPARLLPF